MLTEFRSDNLRGRGYLGVLDRDERIILKRLIRKMDGRMWTGFMWLTIGIIGRLL